MRHPFIYGTLLGFFLLSWEIFLTENGSYDPQPTPVPTALHIGFYGLFIVFLGIGLWKMKKDHQNLLPMKEAFLTGLNMNVMAGIVSAIGLWFYLKDFNPEYLTRMIEGAIAESNGTDQQIEVSENQVAMMRIIWQFLSTTFIGLILTVPVALFLRSKETKRS